MRRYRALRKLGCDWFTAGFIAWVNFLFNVPENEIRFMHLIIEIED